MDTPILHIKRILVPNIAWNTFVKQNHASHIQIASTVKHLLFVKPYFREDTNWDIFTRLYFHDRSYFVL